MCRSPSAVRSYEAYFGIDGPAQIRTSLSYAPADNWMLTLGRSSLLDNVDLQSKFRLFQFRNKTLPSVVSLNLGIAWNTQLPDALDRGKLAGDNFQYFGQLIYNTMLLDKKLGIGVVPSYLFNSDIFNPEWRYTFTLGNYYQYYFNSMWSVMVEYNPIVTGYQGPIESSSSERSYNSLTFGLDIETGGHFFRLLVTNNARLNTSQYLVGSDRSVSSGDWRLGFNISRHL